MKLKKINNKGNLLPEETLKVIIAVIGIALLIYLLFALYNSNVKNRKLAEAEHLLETISKYVDSVKGNSLERIIPDIGKPYGWTIFSFVGNDVKPNQCSGQNCLCICDRSSLVSRTSQSIGFSKNVQEKKCSKEGTCLVIGNLNLFDEILIEEVGGAFTSISVKEVNGKIEVSKI